MVMKVKGPGKPRNQIPPTWTLPTGDQSFAAKSNAPPRGLGDPTFDPSGMYYYRHIAPDFIAPEFVNPLDILKEMPFEKDFGTVPPGSQQKGFSSIADLQQTPMPESQTPLTDILNNLLDESDNPTGTAQDLEGAVNDALDKLPALKQRYGKQGEQIQKLIDELQNPDPASDTLEEVIRPYIRDLQMLEPRGRLHEDKIYEWCPPPQTVPSM